MVVVVTLLLLLVAILEYCNGVGNDDDDDVMVAVGVVFIALLAIDTDGEMLSGEQSEADGDDEAQFARDASRFEDDSNFTEVDSVNAGCVDRCCLPVGER